MSEHLGTAALKQPRLPLPKLHASQLGASKLEIATNRFVGRTSPAVADRDTPGGRAFDLSQQDAHRRLDRPPGRRERAGHPQ